MIESLPIASSYRGSPAGRCWKPVACGVVLAVASTFGTAILPLETTAQEPAQEWTLSPELRIGAIDEGPYSFSNIVSVAAGPSGEILVADYGVQEVRLFHGDGGFVRRIGRAGPGPGEFQALSRVAVRDDTIIAVDRANSEVSYFAWSGEHLLTKAIRSQPIEGQLRPPTVLALLDNGDYLATPTTPAGLYATGERVVRPVVRVAADGAVLGISDELDVTGSTGVLRYDNGVMFMARPVASASLMSVDPRGAFAAFVHQSTPTSGATAAFRVRRVNSDGRVLYARNVQFMPLRLPRPSADSLIEVRVEQFRPQFTREEIERLLNLPEWQPPVTQIVAAEDGPVWLRREGYREDGLVTWWVLDGGGTPTARVELPASTRLLHISGDDVWGVEIGALDVQYAVRYRIVR